jgi:CxxC motif-containing protein (DUF1111 family)
LEPTPPELAEVEEGEDLPGGDGTNRLLLGSNAFIKQSANLSDENEGLFFSGNSFFNQNWVEAPASTQSRDGLGPYFNARSCSSCHFKDGRGHPGLNPGDNPEGLLLRLSIPGVSDIGAPLPEPNYGGQLQDFALPKLVPEGKISIDYVEIKGSYSDGEPYTLLEPIYDIIDRNFGELSEDVLISPRVAPVMIGLGLLEAIPESRLDELSDPEDLDGDGISGRKNSVWDAESSSFQTGRFGWKAEEPSVRQQVAGAFNGDIGITSSIFKNESCTDTQIECIEAISGGDPELADHLLLRVTVYSQAVAVPVRRGFKSTEILRGKLMFQRSGCTSCHAPSHVTGDFPELPAMADQLIWPYTDLLLHDMGEGLSDNRPSFDADGNEWRTPPLWGIGLIEAVNGHQRLLHDGRARGVAEAILWHGGEAAKARAAFINMPKEDREALIRFIESL